MTHTPGPWEIHVNTKNDNSFFVTPAGQTYPFIAEMGRGATHESNAKLIAAAPELLAALEAVFRQTATLRLMPDKNCLAMMANAINKVKG